MGALSPRWQTALDLHHKGLTTVQIGEQIGAKAKDVNNWISQRGLKPNLHRRLFNDEQRLEACKYAEQHGNTAAAEKYGTQRKTVGAWMAERDMKPAQLSKRGPKVKASQIGAKAEAIALSRKFGPNYAAKKTGVHARIISEWQRQADDEIAQLEADGVQTTPNAKRGPVNPDPADPSKRLPWQGKRFRLVKDHSLLRYFLIRREDAATMPKYCTVEHLFPDGRHAIHDRELVASARALRFHPSYLKRLVDVHICDLRGTFARMAMLESGLLKADDDYQLVDLILAMVERDKRRDRMERTDNDE